MPSEAPNPAVRPEAALLKAGALQDAILNSANFSSIANDDKGVIQLFNIGAERMLGYTAIEVVDKITPADISDPQEVIARAKALSAELSTPILPGFDALAFKASRGIEDIYELTYIRKDGSRFPAVVSVTALRDAQDKVIGYLLIGTDNTARKQAEEALLKAGALQNAIFSSANFSSIATDDKGVIQLFNIGAERMLGYTAIEVVDKITPADISDPQEVIARAKVLSAELSTPILPGFEALAFKASRGIEDIYELTYIRKDGSRFPAVVSVTALRDAQERVIGYLLIGTDNSARKRVEAEEKQLDQRLRDHQYYTRSLIESNIDALMTTDPAGIVTDVNKQVESLTGCTRDELIGAPFKNCFTDPERAEECIKSALSGSKVTNYELTVRAWDGKETVVSVNASTFHNRVRELQGVVAAARDVTERKRLEQRQQESNVELERAKAAAEKANLAKSDFLSSMSHELRSPLNAILGFAQIMSSDIPPPSPSQMACIEPILNAGWHLLALINEILDLAQIESGKLELSIGPTSLDPVMLECQTMMEPQGKQRGIKLDFPRFDTPCFVQADPTRLKQVLINLLSNAIKYNNENGTVAVEFAVSPSKGGCPERVRISVKDSGPGLSPDKMGQLFESFNRLGREGGPQEGTGIGLVMSKRLVELMGGVIGVESTLGSGSTFWFDLSPAAARTLPMNRAEGLETAHPRAQDAVAMQTLLYIEDNPANLKLVDKLIERRPNLRLLTAAEGLAGIDLARSNRPDVILLDINLPGINGFEVLTLLRQDQSTAHIPIVALSANAMPRDIEKGLRAGFFRYLTKPFQISQFMDTLDEALNSRIAPARILVVDDLPDNRLLIKSYLKSSPCELTFAEDGQSALNRFSSSDFDLVLMDMQMPVMNGLEATLAIRVIERERGALSIPIIALTPNDSLQEIEKERSAGCNAHLSKPISKTELLRAIEVNTRHPKLMPTEASGSAEFAGIEASPLKNTALGKPASLSSVSPKETEVLLERSTTRPVDSVSIDVLRNLTEDSDLPGLIKIFVANAPAMIADMRRALSDSNTADMLMAAHKLKGSCSNFGATPLRELCARIEEAGSSGDMDGIVQLIVAAEKELHRLVEALGSYREPRLHI